MIMEQTHPEDTQIRPALSGRLCIDGSEYEIDQSTAASLQQGIVPPALQEEITRRQGSDACFDFCRQRRLMQLARSQIADGTLPASLSALIDNGAVPADILFALTHHKLIGKAEKLCRKKLLSPEVLETVRTELLTPEILPPLQQAFLAATALFLYHEGEINREILDGFLSGKVDARYLLIIRRAYRNLCYLGKRDLDHALLEEPDEKGLRYHYESICAPDTEPERIFFSEQNSQYLIEALKWLSPEDYRLIHYIFFEQISMRKFARMEGVSEGTIRYRKKIILGKLRNIFENVMGLSHESIF